MLTTHRTSLSRFPILHIAAWYLLGLLLILAVPSLKFSLPLWNLTLTQLVSFAILVCGYAVSATIAAHRQATRSKPSLSRTLTSTLVVTSFVLLLLLMSGESSSRLVIFAVVCTTVLLTIVPELLGRHPGKSVAALGLATAAAWTYSTWNAASPVPDAARQATERVLPTVFSAVRLTAYKGYVSMPAVRGGGLSLLDPGVLLGTGDGALYFVDWHATDGGLDVRRLRYEVPHNGREFAEDNEAPYRHLLTGEKGPPAGQPQTWRFRVADVLAQPLDRRVRVLASHHYWYRDRRCFVMRVSMLEANRNGFVEGEADSDWTTVYETTPCVPLSGEDAKRTGNPFIGHESGGRMAFLDPQTLLLTVGDHAFSGTLTKQVFAQDASVSYGKTIKLELDTGAAELFTLGHRNPQGLYVDAAGSIWSTEHGQAGGDELNILIRGKNYGWPNVTMGTDYGSTVWPLNDTQGEHEGFESPLFAWLPSVGVSNLIKIRGNAFSTWAGDLLVASLTGQSLFRVRVRDEQVVFVEPIPIGQRIRDIVETADGTILLWTDDAAIVALEPASSHDGDALFASRCSGCHKIADGTLHGVGPDLGRFLERDIASAPDYEYSQALRAHEGRWTEESIAAFLADPESFAPGTTMIFEGISDSKARDALIEYLGETSE